MKNFWKKIGKIIKKKLKNILKKSLKKKVGKMGKIFMGFFSKKKPEGRDRRVFFFQGKKPTKRIGGLGNLRILGIKKPRVGLGGFFLWWCIRAKKKPSWGYYSACQIPVVPPLLSTHALDFEVCKSGENFATNILGM